MSKETKVPYLDGVLRKLGETARISELLARNYYKNHIRGVKSILELDEFIILSYILSNPDLSQSDIAKLVYKGKAHVGKILTELENKGYISRVPATQNNIMVKHTILTNSGRELYERTDAAFKQLGDKFLNGFSAEEQVQFLSLLKKLQKNMLETNQPEF